MEGWLGGGCNVGGCVVSLSVGVVVEWEGWLLVVSIGDGILSMWDMKKLRLSSLWVDVVGERMMAS